MTITIENEHKYSFPFKYKKLANDVIEACMDHLEFPYEAEVNLLIVSADEIKEINSQYRQIDKETDVLSFPLADYEQAGDFTSFALDPDLMNPDTEEALLGDIVICAPKVFAQAEEYGHSPKREFAFLICHSMMHLFGYDHMTQDEAHEMEGLQNSILDKMNIRR